MTAAIEYALLAGASYYDTRTSFNRFPLPQDWGVYSRIPQDSSTGFEAVAFQSQCSNDLVISYAGTNGDGGSILTNPDKQADAALGAGLWSDQLGQAAAYYLEIKALNPGATISFTGHSLGGGLASLMSVLFNETAFTFDQAPFQAALAQAQNLKNYLLTREAGTIDAATLNNLLAPLDRYITAAYPSNLNPIAADTQAARQTQVTNINVQGELLSTFPWNIPNRIGTQSTDIPNNTNGVSADDLHAQSLLTAYLQSNQTAAPNKGLNDVTFKLPDLLKMIFDANLFAHPTNDPKFENLLEHLVRHEAGVQGSFAADAMVTRFTADLWKLAQDGGMTMNDGNSLLFWNNVSKALTAFAMQFYYEDTANATNPNKQLFTDLGTTGAGSPSTGSGQANGIRFDMHDVSKDVAAAMDANAQVDLTKAKGYQYFQAYLDTTSLLSPAERTLIKSILPQLRDWYVQAGSGGMNATDTLNCGAFMLGGAGIDALRGGDGTDLLVGNAGDDLLMGGKGNDFLLGGQGNDTYAYKTGDGFDTILDSDGNGSIAYDGNTLAGGAQYGDNRVFKGADANGMSHLYLNAGQGNLIIDGNIFVKNYKAGDLGLALDGQSVLAQAPTLSGDLAPLLDGNGNFQHDALGNVITDPNAAAPEYQDKLYGGAGDDVLEGRGGIDILSGGNGNDILYGGDRVAVAQAIANGDTDPNANIQGDWLNGGAGSDTLIGSNAADILMGGGGSDLIVGGAGNDHIMGDGDYSTQVPFWSIAQTGPLTKQITALGLDLNAYTTPDGASDVIYAGNGDDFVVGGLGNDIIFGGEGSDTLWGDDANIPQGNDYLEGGKGNDNLIGGGGNDIYAYNTGDGNDKIYDTLTDTNTLLFGAGITLNDLKLSTGDTGYVITLADGSTLSLMSGASGVVNAQGNYTFDPQHTDIQQLQFADGSSIGWGDFLKRGLVQSGSNSIVLGSNYNDELSGANSTLVGGAGSDTYSYRAGDGKVHIKDFNIGGDVNTLKFGPAITAAQIKLGLGSLKLDLGNGDEVHIDNFNPDDALNSATIQRFEFADGSTLTTTELLARGFDLEGTAGNDTITGTNTTDRINGLGGNDMLIGGAGDDTLNGGAGNDMLQGGTGNDTYLVNAGDGRDELLDYSGTNNVVFGAGINLADLTLSTAIGSDGKDALLIRTGANDSLTVDGGLSNLSTNTFLFADGSMLSMSQLKEQAKWSDIQSSEIAVLERQYLAKQEADVTQWLPNLGYVQQPDGSWYHAPEIEYHYYDKLYAGTMSQTFTYGTSSGQSNTVTTTNQTWWQWEGRTVSVSDSVVDVRELPAITLTDPVINISPEYTYNYSFLYSAGLEVKWKYDGCINPQYYQYPVSGYMYPDGSFSFSDGTGAVPATGIVMQTSQTSAYIPIPFNADVGSSLTNAPVNFKYSSFTSGSTVVPQVVPLTYYRSQSNYSFQQVDIGPGNHTVYGGTVVNAGTGNNDIEGAGFVYAGTGNNHISGADIVYLGSGNNTVENSTEIYLGSGNADIRGSQVVYGGSGNNRIDSCQGVYDGSGNSTITNSYYVYDGAGDDVYIGNDVVVAGSGNDTILSSISPSGGYWGTNTTINADMTGNVLVGGIAKINTNFALDVFYRAQGITDWQLRYTHPNTYRTWYSGYWDAQTMASDVDARYGLTLQQAIDQGIAFYNAPLPVLAVVNGSYAQPSSYYAAVGTPVTQLPQITANDYASLAPFYAQMLAAPYPNNDLNNVTFGQGILPSDLHFSWGQVDIAISGSPSDPKSKYTTLNITWGTNNQSVQVIMPHYDEPVGSGVSEFVFADGAKLSMADMIALAPPAPSFDPQFFQYQLGMGSVAIGAGYSGIEFGSGITSSMITLGVGSLMLRVGDNGDVIHITSFDPANALAPNDISKFKFADGTLLSYDQMLSRGFDIYGTAGNDTLTGTNLDNRIYGGSGDDTLIGSGAHDTLDGGAGNDTLIAGSGSETFVFNQGEGQDTIIGSAKNTGDVIQFGAGITSKNSLFMMQGSDLLIKYGDQGDTIRLQNFATSAQNPISKFQYVDGGYSSISKEGYPGNYWALLENYNSSGAIRGRGYAFESNYYLYEYNQSGSINNIGMFNIDGSYNSTAYDANFHVTSFSWSRAGSYGFGNYNVDGSGSGEVHHSDGSYSIYTRNVQLNLLELDYAANGSKLGGRWVKNDGSWGDETYNPDGSSNGKSYRPDGSYSNYTNDGFGLVTAINYDSNGIEVGHSTTITDGSGAVTTVNCDVGGVEFGRSTTTTDGNGVITTVNYDANSMEVGYSITTFDNNGVVTKTNYDNNGAVLGYSTIAANSGGGATTNIFDANNNNLGDYWWEHWEAGVSFGSDNADGSGSGNWHNSDGSYSTYATDALGNYSELGYDAKGNKISDSWWHADSSHGNDIFSADGSSSGETHNADGSYSNYTNDGHGDITTNYFDASGNLLNYSVVADDGLGNIHTSNYDASGALLADSWTHNNSSPLAGIVADQTAVQDAMFSFQIPAGSFSDPNTNDTLTYSAVLSDGGALPSWLTFNAATQTFSGTPGNGDAGSYSVTVTATDTGGLTASSVFAVDVANVNDAPAVSMALADHAALQDAAFSFTVPAGTFGDVDFIHGDTLSYGATLADGSALPGWLTFDAATQTFSGIPGNWDVGNLNVLVTATDTGGLSASSNFALNVVNVNDAPTANADAGVATEDGGAVLLDAATLLANDTDPDFIHGDALNIVGVSQAASGAAVSLLNGNVQYDIGTLFQSLAQGQTATDTFSYTVSDLAGATSTATVTMTVTGVNDGPVTVNDTAAVQEDAAFFATGNVLSNDSDVDQGTVLSVANAGTLQGNYGSLVLNADGSYTYMLDNASLAVQSLAAGQIVTETFAYQATDGIAFTPATLTVSITGTNDAPVAAADVTAAQEDLAIIATGNVLANDSDVDQGTVLSVANAGVFAGSYGQFTLATDGSYSYALNNASLAVQSLAAGQVVTETFAYAATDGLIATPSTLTVTITGTNDAPVTVADAAAVQEDISIAATGNVLINDSDVDHGTVLMVANAGTLQGNYGSLMLNADGSYSYMLDNASLAVQSLAAGQTVTETFGYEATDGLIATPSNLTVTITGTNDAPVATADVAAVQEDMKLTATGNVLGNDSDVDRGTVLSVADAGLRQGSYGSLTLSADGGYSYAVDNASQAVQSLGRTAQVAEHFGYTATDGIAGAAAVLDIFLSGANDAPILVAPLADQNLTFHKHFSWQMPEGSFTDIDQGDTLTYGATLADGSALPDWLKFDAATRTFSGETPKKVGFVDVRVTATDSVAATGSTAGSLSASDVFRVSVSHGNEGVGNGEDAPPPGHDHNTNDGAGTSPGQPGSKGGNGQHASGDYAHERDSDHDEQEKHKNDSSSHGSKDSDSRRTDELIRTWFEEQSASERYSSFSALDRHSAWGGQIDRQVNRNVARGISGDVSQEWERMNARLKKHLEQSGSSDSHFAEHGTGSKSFGLFGSGGQQGIPQLGTDSGQQLKAFAGLKEGLERLGC